MRPEAGTKKRAEGVKKILAVISGKGGVGKSFFAGSLALALAKNGLKIGLLDADIYCPDIFRMFGIQNKISPTADGKIFPVEKWGVRVMSMAGLCATEDEPIAWRGPIITKIISKLMDDTVWNELDMLIIDLPTGAGDIALTILQNYRVDGALIVSTPQPMAGLGSRRTARMLQQLQIPILGIAENMRGELFGEGGGSAAAERIGIPFWGSVPARKQIANLCDQGFPPIFHMEEIDMLFSRIAKQVAEKLLADPKPESFYS